MSRQQRFGLVALALAVAVAAFLILRPGEDLEPSDTDAVPAPAETAPQATEGPEAQPGATQPGGTQPAETQPAEPREPAPTRIRVEAGEPVGGIEEIGVERGDTVRLTVSSDSPQEVHVHGYDLFDDAAPDAPARFEFEADIEGIFEVELEGSHTQIAELRVEP